MNKSNTGWYACFAILSQNFSGEPMVQFDPIIEWEKASVYNNSSGMLVPVESEEGLIKSEQFQNFLCHIDSNDSENPWIREALIKWWKRLLKSQYKPMLH